MKKIIFICVFFSFCNVLYASDLPTNGCPSYGSSVTVKVDIICPNNSNYIWFDRTSDYSGGCSCYFQSTDTWAVCCSQTSSWVDTVPVIICGSYSAEEADGCVCTKRLWRAKFEDCSSPPTPCMVPECPAGYILSNDCGCVCDPQTSYVTGQSYYYNDDYTGFQITGCMLNGDCIPYSEVAGKVYKYSWVWDEDSQQDVLTLGALVNILPTGYVDQTKYPYGQYVLHYNQIPIYCNSYLFDINYFFYGFGEPVQGDRMGFGLSRPFGSTRKGHKSIGLGGYEKRN